MKTNNNVIKIRKVGGIRIKDIDLEAFSQLTEFERIQALHENADMYLKKYKKLVGTLLAACGDGFQNPSSFELARPTNRTGVYSDPVANVAVKSVSLSSGNVEDYYGYGMNEHIDRIIDLERTLNLYKIVINLYDENISSVLNARLEGKSYVDMEMELHYTISTLRQYVYISKDLLEEKYNETICLLKACSAKC